MAIQLLPSEQIDLNKWDQCIAGHDNGLIYSGSSYLNTICSNWHGIVIGDYRGVMPIPWRKKLGLRYAYVPAFVQQIGLSGIFSANELSESIQLLNRFVSLADYHFNFSNKAIPQPSSVTIKTNFIIDLNQDIDTIRSGYSSDLTENIRKAKGGGLYCSIGDIGEAFHHFKNQYADRFPQTKENDYGHFKHICLELKKHNQCFVRTVKKSTGELLAIGLFLKDNNRVYNLMNTTLPEGRKLEANHFLLDYVINECAEQRLLFDFEGSELPGVKKFYEKFGAVNQVYFQYRYNGLPWPFRLLKR